MPVTLDDFDYDLPDDRVAQHPVERRDASRLMVLKRVDGSISHHQFSDLPALLNPGDLLVRNNTQVIPARFQTVRPTGGRIEGLFLHETPQGQWRVMLRNASRCRQGERLSFQADPALGLILEESLGEGNWQVRPDPPRPAEIILQQVGTAPLPPYIQRHSGQSSQTDQQRYQTLYASRPGAVAAPTAGLHFTPQVDRALRMRHIDITELTLHVGTGTFLPVKSKTLAEHPMHTERYELPAATVHAIATTRQQAGRIVAVGTTSVRVLETVAQTHGGTLPETTHRGSTDLFVYPPAAFRVVDVLLTNFHLPRSTLLMLVAAFCSPEGTDGIDMILHAYRTAIAEGYRFYSYGDAMLIL
jgi:S-adenosylmethionine:tRNA ribosyltransferase-isomerase